MLSSCVAWSWSWCEFEDFECLLPHPGVVVNILNAREATPPSRASKAPQGVCPPTHLMLRMYLSLLLRAATIVQADRRRRVAAQSRDAATLGGRRTDSATLGTLQVLIDEHLSRLVAPGIWHQPPQPPRLLRFSSRPQEHVQLSTNGGDELSTA